MRKTDRHLSDQECRDILAEIVNMVLDTHNKPIRKGFGLRLAQSGYDLDSILRNHQVICPGEPNEQERLKLKPKETADEPEQTEE
jgi:hypothetical protein